MFLKLFEHHIFYRVMKNKQNQIKKTKEFVWKAKKTWEVIGQIHSSKKVISYKPEYYGEYYWKIFPKSSEEKVKTIFVLPNIVNQEIWQTLENYDYFDKTFLFIVRKYSIYPNNYLLLDWKILYSSEPTPLLINRKNSLYESYSARI